MAEAFSQEAVLDFLLVHRGKVRNADLTAHFIRFLRDPERQRQSRDQFKKFVNSLAVVRVENGVKYIVLKKRYIEFLPEEIHFSSDVLVPARPEREEKTRHRAVESCPRERQPASCPRERQPASCPRERQPANCPREHQPGCCPREGQPASCPRERPAVAEDRQREAVLSQTQRHPQAQHKPARQQFAKLTVDVVREPQGLPGALRAGNCAGEANDCISVPEGSRLQLEPVRENGKGFNVVQPVRPGDWSEAVSKDDDGSALRKSTEQRSRNSKSKNGRHKSIRLSDGDDSHSSNPPVSPSLSHLPPPRSSPQGRKGKPFHGHAWIDNSETISDELVTEGLQYKPDQYPLNNLLEKSKNSLPRMQKQVSTSTCENKMTKLLKNPPSPKKHESTDKGYKMPLGLLSSSATEVLENSAVYTEECIQKKQRKQPRQHDQPSAGIGQLTGMKQNSRGQSTLPKRGKTSLKKAKSKMSLVSRQSTTRKIMDKQANLFIGSQSLSLAQTMSHSECHKEDPSKIGATSEKNSHSSIEHEWMVKTALGRFEQAYSLFCKDPNFAMKRDFISGYTVLHWIAKHGNHHALTYFISTASKKKIKLNVNIKSTCGYTPLHIAVIHEQLKIIQYLVKKYQANVNLRDHSGKKPWQYLSNESPKNMCQMLGAPDRKPAMHSVFSSTVSAKDINTYKSSSVSRKTSFTALLKSPRVLQKVMHHDPLNTIIEDDDED
ncbi:ankyrin repeat domain-containing protein SOWAHB-like [Stegostoma tigrinum]|uniref:ankyrin repeat domain-containing protein SOWAHB-like n=1 Tax=Stegostoma tigrinum TaxID=3053191 RepID=UPI00202B2968|nr:ankyrin repeat domain-containing protein SOWAHB-like [Stegostoma tigrinum]